MKKIVTLLLIAAMSATMFSGCTSLGVNDKGAEVNMYIGNDIRSFDPATEYVNDNAVKFLGLVYAGLTRINEDGDVENYLIDDYKIVENEDDNIYRMEITLCETKWSDGTLVSANDVVFAWKRILNPEFDSPASVMLFDIKNAREVKAGDCSIDDLGVTAEDSDLVYVYFNEPIDYDLFLEKLASPALVPLREDIVGRYDDFDTESTHMVASGPFSVKNWGSTARGNNLPMSLVRNSYFFRNPEDDELDKSVLPAEIIVEPSNSDQSKIEAGIMEAYNENKVFYNGEIAIDSREEAKDDAITRDLLSTASIVFNFNKNKAFKKAEVRKALSLALDREAIADTVIFGKPATGFIPYGVYDEKVGDIFRENGDDVISPSADMDEANSLIKSAKLKNSEKKLKLLYFTDGTGTAIAEAVKAAWEELGFTVTLQKGANARSFYKEYEKLKDGSAGFDVALIDMQMLSTDAFDDLAIFSKNYSGMGIDIQNDDYDAVPYFAGFDDKDYDKLIDEAFAMSRDDRSDKLHEAEAKLAEGMPYIPVMFNVDAYIYNDDVLSKIGDTYYGARRLEKLVMEDYEQYKKSNQEDEEASEDEE